MADTVENSLRRLVLSAAELQKMTDWPDALIEDYLNILDDLIKLAQEIDDLIDKKIEEIDTDFTDGSIPFADGGFLVEDNSDLFWDAVSLYLGIGTNIPIEKIDENIRIINEDLDDDDEIEPFPTEWKEAKKDLILSDKLLQEKEENI